MIEKLALILLCIGASGMCAAAERTAPTIPAVPNNSSDPRYADSVRMFQGIPGIERAPNGRLWAAWYGGGVHEDKENYVLLYTSGDDGKSWQQVFVLDPDEKGPVRAFDPCLWIDPVGRLWLFWAQSVIDEQGKCVGYSLCATTTNDPGSASAKWTSSREICDGVMMNKPVVAADGRWLLPVARWFKDGSSRIMASTDGGNTFVELGSSNVPKKDRSADEHMLIQRRDGTLWMLARTAFGIGESISSDGGQTWPEMEPSGIPHTVSRFFIRRLSSGRLLLVRHAPPDLGKDGTLLTEKGRSYLTAFLSDDDGRTWKGGLLLDERQGVSYPDGVQAPDGTIRVIYDWNRTGDKQILMAVFKEEDVLAGGFQSPVSCSRVLVNQATGIDPTTPVSVADVEKNPNTDGVTLSKEVAAEIESSDGELSGFDVGAKIFSNRGYVLAEVPDALRGFKFIRDRIEGTRAVCRKSGLVYVVTPLPTRNGNSVSAKLLKQGFEKVALPEFLLFATQFGSDNLCSVYQKQVATGEALDFGLWGVLIVPEKN